jgi:rhodanese-related sulfurtransferase
LLVLGILGFLLVAASFAAACDQKLAAARLEPEELKQWLDAGEPVYIVDLRHPLELCRPFTLPGAHRISLKRWPRATRRFPATATLWSSALPQRGHRRQNRMTLHKLGIERVRPLRGGYDEWKRLGFPMDACLP